MRLFADYHTHTCYSHGRGTVLENVRAARIRGLEAVGIADHGPANLFGVGVSDLDTFAAIRREVEEARRLVDGVDVLFAVEANVVGADGELDIPLPMQETFDLVLAGLHIMVRPRSWWTTGQVAITNIFARAWQGNERAALVRNTDLLVAAVYRNRIDIVTHPGYRLPIDTRELARACVLTGTALEINTSHPHITVRYLQRAAQTGVRFVISSDAHDPSRVGDLARGVELVRAAGVDPAQILNAVEGGRDQLRRSELYKKDQRLRFPGSKR